MEAVSSYGAGKSIILLWENQGLKMKKGHV
jgi:hypothetical protein